MDCYLEAAESNRAIDQQKAGLKLRVQSVSCCLKDAFWLIPVIHSDLMVCEVAFNYFRHVTVKNIVARLIKKLKAVVVNSQK